MEFDFLKPLDNEILQVIKGFSSQQLGSKVVFHTAEDFPDLDKIKIAIVGVLENRGDVNQAEEVDLSHIRKELYGLFPGNWDASIADLGNILAGNSITDTHYALRKVVSTLIKKKIIPIIIGGTQDLTYALYRAYDELEQMVNLVSIDSKFDFGKESDAVIASSSYLTKIIIEEPNNLFNFCNLGYQTYLNSQEEIDLIDKLFFEAYRLGEISNSITLSEPVFRDADLVSLDLTAIKSYASGNFTSFSPNGFSGKEICALSRYAGISDKVSLFGIFNHNNSAQESVLIAQIIWYFIEGFQYRSNEYPFGSRENYIKYIVPLEEELIFYKSNKTDRWWIEIPFISDANNKLKKSSLLPCSYEEYLGACNQEIPERWWKAQRKNTI
ncbi:formimidoylglutamase [Flavobacterium sp.]|uniref:formimidoylglutamase n=1 Tax=Flavobacterium sp. TaxID=239 RepID=UPI00286E71BC|nr:formimidoylglutamase [Flavobacterium sp.]